MCRLADVIVSSEQWIDNYLLCHGHGDFSLHRVERFLTARDGAKGEHQQLGHPCCTDVTCAVIVCCAFALRWHLPVFAVVASHAPSNNSKFNRRQVDGAVRKDRSFAHCHGRDCVNGK